MRPAGRKVADSLSGKRAPAQFSAADLTDPTRRRGSSRVRRRFGRIDALVNAAGLTDRASFLDADIDDWTTLFDVNARAPFFLMQAAIKAMRERGEAVRSSTSCR